MERPNPFFRRQALRLAGGTVVTALVAGCLSDDEGGDSNRQSDENGAETGNETPDIEQNPTDNDGPEDETTADEETNGEANDRATSGAWDAGTEIVLSATTAGWEGIEPEVINGEDNPTLVLNVGKDYVITWKNSDGRPHNIEIWDENEEVVEDYKTELMNEEGSTQSLKIEAQEAMAEYICEIHADWSKRGDIEIEVEE